MVNTSCISGNVDNTGSEIMIYNLQIRYLRYENQGNNSDDYEKTQAVSDKSVGLMN